MKSIDFSKPGGFPLTQDQLHYLQTAYREAALALARMGGSDSGPFIISGMEVTNPTPGEYAVTEGWFFYYGEIIRIPNSGISGIAAGHDVYVQLSSDNSSVIFNDGLSKEVILDSFGSLVSLPTGTPEDASRFLLSSLRRFGTGFGLANRENTWNTLVVNTDPAVGGVTGTVYYKKNFITNTLQIRGLLSANNAQNFAASPAALYSLMGTLPTEYSPINNTHFTAHYFVATLVKDDMGIAWIKQLNCGLNNFGQLYINWIRPDSSILGYGVNFNVIVSLD